MGENITKLQKCTKIERGGKGAVEKKSRRPLREGAAFGFWLAGKSISPAQEPLQERYKDGSVYDRFLPV